MCRFKSRIRGDFLNNLEERMVTILEDLKKNHHVIGVKTEFEDECARVEEAMRLKKILSKAGLDLTIKIGGCGALKDLYEARTIGVSSIIAPMIESDYALKKFLTAAKLVFSEEERKNISFSINIETITGFNNFNKMLETAEIDELDGIVLGRTDMTRSLGLSYEKENSDQILEIAKSLFIKAKEKSLKCCMGGGISADTLDFIKKLPERTLDKYETRKIIFKCPEALAKNADEGILKAIEFELMWLKNNRDFYGMIYSENEQRISIIEERYQKLAEQTGKVRV
jgi:hypothetical protein